MREATTKTYLRSVCQCGKPRSLRGSNCQWCDHCWRTPCGCLKLTALGGGAHGGSAATHRAANLQCCDWTAFIQPAIATRAARSAPGARSRSCLATFATLTPLTTHCNYRAGTSCTNSTVLGIVSGRQDGMVATWLPGQLFYRVMCELGAGTRPLRAGLRRALFGHAGCHRDISGSWSALKKLPT